MRGYRFYVSLLLALLLAASPPCAAEIADPLYFTAATIDVAIGESIDLSERIEGALSHGELQYVSEDPAIARVDGSGTLTALSLGRTRVFVRAPGGAIATAYIRALRSPSSRRALIISEQRYLDGRIRTGAINTAQGMSDMLTALRYRTGTNFEVTVRVDSTETELAESITETFGNTKSSDISIFYINCHGEIRGGEACLILHDGTAITVRRLEQLLRQIQGHVIVMLDCCGSGAFIGRTANKLYVESAAQCFRDSPLLNGKYLVMTSCGSEQDSYRISDTGDVNESAMATVFARSFCEGLGWDLDRDRSVSLRADADRDGVVTFTEIWTYTRRRVLYHLSGTGAEQTVMAWPEINEAELFARQSAS